MATQIVVGLSTYLIDFAGGQVGFRTPPYTQYATDLDTNFVTLRTTINQMIGELNALAGPNAGLGIDLLQFDRAGRSGGTLSSGLVGADSYRVTIGAPTSNLDVSKGVALISGTKVSAAGTTVLAGSGGAGTRWVALDVNGVPTLQLNSGLAALDVYSAAWNGAAFTSVTRLAEVFFDGDEYERMRDRAVLAPSWSAKKYESFSGRLRAIERLLAGLATDEDAAAIGPPALAAGAVGAPSLTFNGDTNTGIYSPAADQVAISTAGVQRFLVTTQVFFAGGSAGSPGLAPTGDPNTGLFGTGSDVLGFATAGAECGRFDPTGNLDLALNSRVKGVRSTAQSIADNTPTLVDFNAADAFDVGAWHDHASGTLSVRQEFTVPAGADGLYLIVADYEWASPTNATDLVIEVTVGGVADPSRVEDQIPAAKPRQGQLLLVRSLAAADVVRMQVTQDDTGGAASLNLERASLSILKVA